MSLASLFPRARLPRSPGEPAAIGLDGDGPFPLEGPLGRATYETQIHASRGRIEMVRVSSLPLPGGEALLIVRRATALGGFAVNRYVELSVDLWCTCTSDGKIRAVNSAWWPLLGLRQEDLLDRRMIRLTHPEDRPTMISSWGQLQVGDLPASLRFRMQHRDGTWRWFDWSAMRDPREDLVYAVGRDVTGQVNAESERARLATIVEQSRELVAVADYRGRLIYVNPAGRDLVGLDREVDPGGWSLADLQPTNSTQFQGVVLPAVRSSGAWEGECTLRHQRSGRLIEVAARVAAVRTDGDGDWLAVVIRDISAYKKADRLKSEWVSTVSHELRTPLTSIRGALGLLDSGVLGDLPAKAADLVRIARTNSDRLLRLVNDLLELERMRFGAVELDLQAVDSQEAVDAAFAMVRVQADNASVTLVSRVPPGLIGLADPDRLRQVLVNLIGNAVKFSPAASCVTVTGTLDGAQVLVEVADEGPGIPATMRERVFEKFQQVDASDTRAKQGSGLGLTIARSIVEQHRGEIGVRSEEGQGATFWFRIPASGVTTDAPAPVERRLPVLLVGSDPVLLAALEPAFEAGDYAVSRARSSDEAREILGVVRPSALVVDAGGLHTDAVDRLTDLALDPRSSALPMLVLTDGDDPRSVERGSGHVHRTVAPDRVVRELDVLLRRERDRTRVLVVDADPFYRKVLAARITRLGAQVLEATDGPRALDLARIRAPHVLVADAMATGLDGVALVEALTGLGGAPAVVLYTRGDLPSDLAMRLAAHSIQPVSGRDVGAVVGRVKDLLSVPNGVDRQIVPTAMRFVVLVSANTELHRQISASVAGRATVFAVPEPEAARRVMAVVTPAVVLFGEDHPVPAWTSDVPIARVSTATPASELLSWFATGESP
jgi:PAS domain S-box-containing protein